MTSPEPRPCASCGNAPAGDGGILCRECADRIRGRGVRDWYPNTRDLPDVQAPGIEEAGSE
jgi:hypothetical protein